MHSRLRRSLARLLPVEIIHWRARRKSSLSDKNRVLVETMLLNLLYPHDFGFTFQRFGSPYDGGYVLPREIAIHAGIGIGIRDNWDFERDLEMQLGIHVVTVDTQAPDLAHPRHIPRLVGQVSRDSSVSMDELFLLASDRVSIDARNGNSWLLKMDIEGHEYLALPPMSHQLWSRFAIVVIEIHGLHLVADAVARRALFEPLVSRLLSTHQVVFCHPCWEGYKKRWRLGRCEPELPRAAELTLVRKDLLGCSRGLLDRDISRRGGRPNRSGWRLKELPDPQRVFRLVPPYALKGL
jgi:hypothetical protein